MKYILILIFFVSLAFGKIEVEDHVLVLTEENFQEAQA